LPRSGGVLIEFLPVEQLLAACEAIIRVFKDEGERKNLAKARMKWIIRRIGWDGYLALFQKHFEAILAEGGRPLPEGEPIGDSAPQPPASPPAAQPSQHGFEAWKTRSVRPQVQAGFVTALVWLRIGDVSSVQLRRLAELVEQLGDGTVRTTQSQNLLIRWIPESHVGNLWQGLQRVGLGDAHAEDLSDVVSCPGAETCRIAVTASRGVAQLLGEHLSDVGADAGPADIKVSGCPNGCAQHHIATIGLQGGVRKVGGDLVPQYHLTLGGGVDERGASFGRLIGKIPARRVPAAVDRLLAHFKAHAEAGEGLRAYFQRLETSVAKELVADLAELNESNARPEDFIDLGSSVKFEVVAMDGECAQ
jgi:sulfite reductase (NADPH) hemoprotein beta-component